MYESLQESVLSVSQTVGTPQSIDERLLYEQERPPQSIHMGLAQTFEEFYYPLLRRVCHILHDSETSKEITMDVFVTVMKNRERFESGTNLSAWLFRIATNKAINEYRRRKQYPVSYDPSWVALERVNTTTPEQEVALGEKLRTTKEYIWRTVPNPFKEAVLYCDVLGYSYKEAAAEMRVPRGTVMSRLFRGRRALEESCEKGTVELFIKDKNYYRKV